MIFGKYNKIKKYVKSLSPRIFGFRKYDKIKVFPLPKGLWNDLFIIEINRKPFVMKIYLNEDSTDLYTNNGETEYFTLETIKSLGIAPRPVFFDDSKKKLKKSVLIYEYAYGRITDLREEDVFRVAEILAQTHLTNLNEVNFLDETSDNPKDLIKDIEIAFSKYRDLPNVNPYKVLHIKNAITKLKRKTRIMEKFPYDKSFCHTDLIPSNIISDGKKVKIIDWQSPSIRDPAFDVWLYTSEIANKWDLRTSMPDKQKNIFVKRYVELTGDQTIVKRVIQKEPFYLLRMAIYCAKRSYDYKSKRIPKRIRISRKKNFEKYEACLVPIFDRLTKII